MRLLLDNCLSYRLAAHLREAGHDVESVAEWDADPGDEILLRYANEQQRVLVTLDADFPALAAVHGVEHHGMIRIVRAHPFAYLHLIRRAIELHATDLKDHSIVITAPSGCRVRRP